MFSYAIPNKSDKHAATMSILFDSLLSERQSKNETRLTLVAAKTG